MNDGFVGVALGVWFTFIILVVLYGVAPKVESKPDTLPEIEITEQVVPITRTATSQIGLACDGARACPDAPNWCLMTIRGDGKVFHCDKEIREDDKIYMLLVNALEKVDQMNVDGWCRRKLGEQTN